MHRLPLRWHVSSTWQAQRANWKKIRTRVGRSITFHSGTIDYDVLQSTTNVVTSFKHCDLQVCKAQEYWLMSRLQVKTAIEQTGARYWDSICGRSRLWQRLQFQHQWHPIFVLAPPADPPSIRVHSMTQRASEDNGKERLKYRWALQDDQGDKMDQEERQAGLSLHGSEQTNRSASRVNFKNVKWWRITTTQHFVDINITDQERCGFF